MKPSIEVYTKDFDSDSDFDLTSQVSESDDFEEEQAQTMCIYHDNNDNSDTMLSKIKKESEVYRKDAKEDRIMNN